MKFRRKNKIIQRNKMKKDIKYLCICINFITIDSTFQFCSNVAKVVLRISINSGLRYIKQSVNIKYDEEKVIKNLSVQVYRIYINLLTYVKFYAKLFLCLLYNILFIKKVFLKYFTQCFQNIMKRRVSNVCSMIRLLVLWNVISCAYKLNR